jgi:AT-rich interactive domain-containing protein 1
MFLDRLLSFMEERGTPITQCPTISKNPLDLYKLYAYTKDRGGYLEVSTGCLGEYLFLVFLLIHTYGQ